MASKPINLQTPWFPSKYIIAAINEPEETVGAVVTLHNDEGVNAEHILLLGHIEVTCEDCGLLQQILWFFLRQCEGAGLADCHSLWK